MNMTTRIINTHDQLTAAGGGVAITKAYTAGRESSSCGWAVYRVNKDGNQVITDPQSHWSHHGKKVFFWMRPGKMVALNEAKAWILEKYGEAGPWKRNPRLDYVPERINKAFPLPKKEKTK
jgi:hypothetical protein